MLGVWRLRVGKFDSILLSSFALLEILLSSFVLHPRLPCEFAALLVNNHFSSGDIDDTMLRLFFFKTEAYIHNVQGTIENRSWKDM